MTELMNSFISTFTGKFGEMQSIALSLLAICATIDFVYSVIFDMEQIFKLLPIKAMQYGIWLWLIQDSQNMANIIRDGFIQVGQILGGGGGLYKDPSGIMANAMDFVQAAWNYGTIAMKEVNGIGKTLEMAVFFLLQIIVTLLLLGCYLFIALCVTLQNILWALMIPLFIPLLGFAVLPKLSFLAQSAINGIISISSRYAVLVALLGVSETFLQTPFNPPAELLSGDAMFWVLGHIIKISIIVTLCYVAPSMAAGFMSGAAPNLNPMGGTGAARSLAGAGAAAASAGTTAAAMGTGGAIGGIVGAKTGWQSSESGGTYDKMKKAAQGGIGGADMGMKMGKRWRDK